MWENGKICNLLCEFIEILKAFNEIKTDINQQIERVQEFENICNNGIVGALSKVKIKVIQGIIQVKC
jgi:hypothetical protein